MARRAFLNLENPLDGDPFGSDLFTGPATWSRKAPDALWPTKGQKAMYDLMRQNLRDTQRVIAAGATPPVAGSKPNLLERVLGPLQAPLAGINALVHNLTNRPDDQDVSIISEMKSAFRGGDYISGSDLLAEWGWDPKTSLGKFAKGVVGFAWDFALDPLTYASFGLAKATKLRVLTKAAEVADKGVDAATLARYGVDVVDDVADIYSLTAGQRSQLFKGIVRDVVHEMGDKGGIKFFGRSLVKGESIAKAVPEPVKRFASAVQRSDAAMGIAGLFDRTYKLRHMRDPFTAAVFAEYMADMLNQANKVRHEGLVAAKALDKALPKGTHHFVGLALEDTLVQSGRADEIAELVDTIGKLSRSIEQGVKTRLAKGRQLADLSAKQAKLLTFQKRLGELVSQDVDWDLFAESLRRHLPRTEDLSDAEIDQAVKAMKGFRDRMRELRLTETAKGLTVPDRGPTYFPHVPGQPGKEVVDLMRLEPEKMPGLGPPKGVRGQASFGKRREYGTLGEALMEDARFATFAPEVMAKRYTESGLRQAAADFQTRIYDAFGRKVDSGFKEAGKSVVSWKGAHYAIDKVLLDEIDAITRPLLSDEAARRAASFLARATSWWRRWATVMNPGFVPRNAISNGYLAYTKGFDDPSSWLWAIKLRAGLVSPDAKVPGLKVTVREFMDRARSDGVLRGGRTFEAMEDWLRGGYKRRNPLAWAGSTANEFAEEWGRLAVYHQAWRRHGQPKLAARLVDATLYNYDPKALTAFEQGTRNVLVPFMIWTRRNLPEMLSVLLHDPSKVSVIGKAQRNMEDTVGGIDRRLMPQYMRDMLPIPLPFKTKDGDPILLNPNFGFQDLNRLDEPLRDVLASISPFFKLPLELAMDRDVYFQSEITRYKGELRKAPGYLQKLDDVFHGQDWWEFIKLKGGAKTVDGVLKAKPAFVKTLDAIPFLASLGKALETDSPQNPWRTISWLAGVKLMPYQEERFTQDVLYQERDALRDAIRKLRDEGVIR